MENVFGLMEENIKDNGKTIKCMEREITIGQVEDNIVVFSLLKLRGLCGR